MRIKKGDRGSEVVDIQRRLSGLGYDLGPTIVDGAFEQRTQAAVEAFQRKHDLQITGTIDTSTWRMLVDASYRLGDRALYLRSPFLHGHDVTQLQRWLNTLGFHRESVDGIFGPTTERSIREFQLNVGLFPDGIVGPSTVAALSNLRQVLDKSEDSAYPKQPLKSFVSGMKGKKIAVGCSGFEDDSWWDWPEESGLLYIDLAHRFSNLLELLGAEITLFRPEDACVFGTEISIAFVPGAATAAITIRHADEQSDRSLAEAVVAALTESLKNQTDGIDVTTTSAKSTIPAITIATGGIASLVADSKLKQDIIKQKIAGAIFDGLKNFLEGSREFSRP